MMGSGGSAVSTTTATVGSGPVDVNLVPRSGRHVRTWEETRRGLPKRAVRDVGAEAFPADVTGTTAGAGQSRPGRRDAVGRRT